MEFETRTTTSQRLITESEQHTCDRCGEPATSSCTDAVQTLVEGALTMNPPIPSKMEMWTQSAHRYGCAKHEVKPEVHFADGRTMTWEEYAKS